MSRQNQFKESFAKALRTALVQHYRTRPSAAMLARDYNLRTHGGTSISQETARRWLRGECFPDEDKLQILAPWLDLDLNALYGSRRKLERQFEPLLLKLTEAQRLSLANLIRLMIEP